MNAAVARSYAFGIFFAAAAVGCNGGDEAVGGDEASGGADATTDTNVTTLPLTTTATVDTGTTDATPATGSTSTDASTSTDTTSTSSDTSSSSGTADGTGDSSDSGGEPTDYDVSWCRLQYPPEVTVAVDEAFAVFVRLYAAGLTDLSGVNDPAGPQLVVEMGYGLDGSDPSMGLGGPWTWTPAGPNAGYGPGAPGYEANNDEYVGDVTIPMAGIYAYASRISGDGGLTWVYCDLDDLLNGGYTPDQAGVAFVGQ